MNTNKIFLISLLFLNLFSHILSDEYSINFVNENNLIVNEIITIKKINILKNNIEIQNIQIDSNNIVKDIFPIKKIQLAETTIHDNNEYYNLQIGAIFIDMRLKNNLYMLESEGFMGYSGKLFLKKIGFGLESKTIAANIYFNSIKKVGLFKFYNIEINKKVGEEITLRAGTFSMKLDYKFSLENVGLIANIGEQYLAIDTKYIYCEIDKDILLEFKEVKNSTILTTGIMLSNLSEMINKKINKKIIIDLFGFHFEDRESIQNLKINSNIMSYFIFDSSIIINKYDNVLIGLRVPFLFGRYKSNEEEKAINGPITAKLYFAVKI